MPITDLPVLSALRTKMQWHQERQRVLAQNIANSDTPGFKPRDLMEPTFDRKGVSAAGGPAASLPLLRTSSGHLGASGSGGSFAPDRKVVHETRPTGNAVNLEDEMQKVAANQMDYAAATTLYTKSLGLLKTAIGRR